MSTFRMGCPKYIILPPSTQAILTMADCLGVLTIITIIFKLLLYIKTRYLYSLSLTHTRDFSPFLSGVCLVGANEHIMLFYYIIIIK